MGEAIFILVLILLNGVFSMSEIALISARKSNLQSEAEKGNKASENAFKLASNPDKFLSSVQIGITLIGILTGLISGDRIADTFTEWLTTLGISAGTAATLAKTIIVIIVTFLTILLGELVPKRIGLSNPEKVSKRVAGPMRFFSWIANPAVNFLAKSTEWVSRMLGIRANETKVTEEEIKFILQEGTEDGEVSPVEQDLVEKVFTLGDLSISTIMTLRDDIVWLDTSMDKGTIQKTIENNVFEQYPVANGDLDHVIGVLSLKDYVVKLGDMKPDEVLNLKEMMKEPVYFHENMNVYAVLEDMKENKVSRALVCDEFGSLCGIISLKDILNALVGNLGTEPQKDPDIVARHDGDGWLVDGQMSIYDFLNYFDIEDSMEDYDFSTVAGMLMEVTEHVPVTGEKCEWKDFSFEVADKDGARIDKVIVKKLPEKPLSAPEGDQ